MPTQHSPRNPKDRSHDPGVNSKNRPCMTNPNRNIPLIAPNSTRARHRSPKNRWPAPGINHAEIQSWIFFPNNTFRWGRVSSCGCFNSSLFIGDYDMEAGLVSYFCQHP